MRGKEAHMIHIDPELLKSTWLALSEPISNRHAFSSKAILEEVADEGWMHGYQLDDLVHDSELRLARSSSCVDLRALSEAMGYRWLSTYRRPNMRSNGAVGTQSLSAVDAAAFLLDLQTLGFAIDPWPLVDRLRPAIARKTHVTDPELQIFWAPRVKDRGHLVLVSEQEWYRGEFKRGKLASGHRYEVWLGPEDAVYKLEVKAPKYRQARSPVKTICPDCGDTWYRGDPDSSAAHRREHKQRLHVLDPKPLADMLSARLSMNDPELVRSTSPKWKHFEMYERARAFRREEGYDFVQWNSHDGDDDPHVHGFLMSDAEGRILGAISFRWREPRDEPAFWGLQWVWIAPKMRRRGILSSRWAVFRERFGDFVVESPVSETMQAFLSKHGDTHLMDWPSERALRHSAA
jgi:hypothetical protein